ncbi:type I-E CRISPR-associated protein Cse1/CasA [Bifidobacterium callitrichidarum]|uniref:type I-E CRISPR-associated protein Cse1/CasA n=1 Tax=Bifidobacterium callitrichidarum TaxID=2052941 RepID=UPI001304A7D3|nr:type I-E CRISPR-associated protein Cse1/CasA [Bifidobacterium callitrichidarum]
MEQGAILKSSTQRAVRKTTQHTEPNGEETPTNTYNLLDQPWLPATGFDRETHDYGITGLFENATRLLSLDGDNDAQRFTLHRLLIAIITRAYGEDLDPNEWHRLYDEGPDDQLFDYLEEYRDRFDLLDPERPFFQVPGLTKPNDKGPDDLGRLLLDIPNDNQSTAYRRGVESISFAEAARCLVAVQAYDTSGNKPRMEGDNRETGGNINASGTGWCGAFEGILILGDSLWHTLMLNTVGVTGDEAYEISDDIPIWEQEIPDKVGGRDGYDSVKETFTIDDLHGPATLMTWQSRRILLAHDGEKVTGVRLTVGDRIRTCDAMGYETMCRFKEDQDKKVITPIKANEERGLWRDFPTFLNITDQTKINDAQDEKPAKGKCKSSKPPLIFRPKTIDWLKICGVEVPATIEGFGASYGPMAGVITAFTYNKISTRTSLLVDDSNDLRIRLNTTFSQMYRWVGSLRNLCDMIKASEGITPTESTPILAFTALNAKRAWSLCESEFDAWLASRPDAQTALDTVQELETACKDKLYWFGYGLYLSASSKALVGRIGKDGFVSAATAWNKYSYMLRKGTENQ